MPSSLVMADHNFEVNREPLSEVKSNGMPIRAIQWKTGARLSVSSLQWDCLWPSGKLVHNGEEMGAAL